MKNLILLLMLSGLAEAKPLPDTKWFQGSYGLAFESSNVLSQQEHRVVYSSNEAGQKLLQELRSQGYECTYKMAGDYDCARFDKDLYLKDWHYLAATEKYEGCQLSFAKAFGEPRILSDGEELQIWEIPQKVNFCGKFFSVFRYIRGPGIEKIFLGEPVQYSINIKKEIGLFLPVQVQKTQTQRQFWISLLEVPFFKK